VGGSNAAKLQAVAIARERIRQSIMSWMTNLLLKLYNSSAGYASSPIPYYLLNNVISVVTLCIKFDFPHSWPGAFGELLQAGYAHGLHGIDFVVRVLRELEMEVVMFSESRSKEEVIGNAQVKDAMRDSVIVKDILSFLCQSIQHTQQSQRSDLCASCLLSMGELVSWVDINLVVQDALPVVYQQWMEPTGVGAGASGVLQRSPAVASVRQACASCFAELVKKGMEPAAKVRLVQAVGLVSLLARDQRLPLLLRGSCSTSSSTSFSSSSSSSAGAGRDRCEEEIRELEQVGVLLDSLVLEALGCWCTYEDLLFKHCSSSSASSKGGGGNSTSSVVVAECVNACKVAEKDLYESIPVAVSFLNLLLPLLLSVFMDPELRVSVTTLPTCSRLVNILKQQQQRAQFLDGLEACAPPLALVGVGDSSGGGVAVFRAELYLNSLLSAIYAKSQYPADFDYSILLEDELNDDVEVGCCVANPRLWSVCFFVVVMLAAFRDRVAAMLSA
jgi:hypothetical protein